jgi:hypothetical protein
LSFGVGSRGDLRDDLGIALTGLPRAIERRERYDQRVPDGAD